MNPRLIPGRCAAMAGYSCLMVALYVAEPAVVSLTVLPADRGDSPPDHVPALTVLR